MPDATLSTISFGKGQIIHQWRHTFCFYRKNQMTSLFYWHPFEIVCTLSVIIKCEQESIYIIRIRKDTFHGIDPAVRIFVFNSNT